MALCPNCRHEVSLHSSSHECGEPGCSCIFEPQSTAAFERTAVTPAPLINPADRRRLPGDSALMKPLFLVLEHPFIALVLLSASLMGLYYGIGVLEKGPATHEWMSRHRVALDWLKGVLIVLAVPGAIIVHFWVPGMNAKDLADRSSNKWTAYLLAWLAIAALLYGAARIYLAGR